jgi:hypothetical protein
MGYAVLCSVNPEQGRARYYALTWQPALDSGWVVERAWGPLRSSRRQRRTNHVEEREKAMVLVTRHLKRRLRHDYRLAAADADGRVLFDGVGG